MTRRRFVQAGALIGAGLGIGSGSEAADAPAPRSYRAAVIGRTGGGDYGHGYDLIFRGLPRVTLVAIADANPQGLQQAAQRTGAQRSYLDYQEMLAKEKPDLVSIAPRQPDCHKEMALAALDAGAHIFMEKPITETVAEADLIVETAKRKGLKVAVAHTRRFGPDFAQARALIREGFLGEIREVRIQGKQDARAGGEDLIVLGTHDFDLMRFYFGDPRWCFASVMQAGRDVELADARRGQEPIRVAGDAIDAMFDFRGGLKVHWSSVKRSDHWNTAFSRREKWAFEILGTRRILAYQSGFGFAYLDSPFPAHKDELQAWKELPQPRNPARADHEKQPIENLIHAIETDAAPLCSGDDGRWAIEMVSAVYQSHLARARIAFPLSRRGNPLLPP